MQSRKLTKLKTSPLRYVGAKFKQRKNLASIIQKLCPNHKEIQYRELFCGSGAVALELLESGCFNSYWLNDNDYAVYAYWNSIKDHYFWLKEYLRGNYHNVTESEFLAYRAGLLSIKRMPADKELVEIAIEKLIVQRHSFNGMGTKSSSPIKNIEGRWNQRNLRNALNQIHALLCKNDTKITQGDFERLIWDTSTPAFLYIDPPYFKMGDDLYQTGFTERDHVRLAQALKESGQPFLLSYDYCVEVLDLYYQWADFEKIDVFYHGNKKVKQEILIYKQQ